MPFFQDTDPRHPQNRCKLVHAALVQGAGEGTKIPLDRFRIIIKVLTGVSSQRAVKDYMSDLADYGMVAWEKGKHVTVQPLEASII